MRVLAIAAGFILASASVCLAQNVPAVAPPATLPNPALHQQLEELKAKYGAKPDALNSTEIVLQPKPGRQNINVMGDTRSLYNNIATAFGLRVTFDESIKSRNVRFNLQNVDLKTAVEAAGLMTHTFVTPVTSKEFLVATDTVQKRRELERMLERTFYLSNATTPQQITDIVNLLRTLLEIRHVVPQPGTSSITVRANQSTMHEAEELVSQLDLPAPQVTLDIQAFEVNTSMQRDLGVSLPLQFQMFNINSNILALLNSPDAQSAIQQFLNSGGANLGQLAALVGQSQNELQSLLANPVATFGGGLTLMAVGIPPVTANFSQNSSRVTTLEQATLQASQGNPATFHVGNRYPVLTQSFSSGLSAPGINIGLVGTIPGFTYEDLGVLVKAKPQIHGISAVTLDMEMSIKSLGSQVLNGVPVIQNREYKGVITVKDGEPAVLAGTLSNSETRSFMGPPGIGSIPVLNKLVSTEIKSHDQTELVIVVTPHIRSARTATDAPPIVAN